MQLNNCPICLRNVERLEIHHYKPESLGGTLKETMMICGSCHDMIHYYIPIHEIEQYPTPDHIKSHSKFTSYLNWIRQKNNSKIDNVKKILKKIKEKSC